MRSLKYLRLRYTESCLPLKVLWLPNSEYEFGSSQEGAFSLRKRNQYNDNGEVVWLPENLPLLFCTVNELFILGDGKKIAVEIIMESGERNTIRQLPIF